MPYPDALKEWFDYYRLTPISLEDGTVRASRWLFSTFMPCCHDQCETHQRRLSYVIASRS